VFPAEKFWIDMENSGNTVSSTIPIALEGALNQGRVKIATASRWSGSA
jgi:3-oxoacyl-[acyl-carrier-protein] synthase-3